VETITLYILPYRKHSGKRWFIYDYS